MLLNCVLLCALAVQPAPAQMDVVISPIPDGVEVKVGGFVLTGSSVRLNQKGQVVEVVGSDKVAARAEVFSEGKKTVLQGKNLRVNLSSGQVTVLPR